MWAQETIRKLVQERRRKGKMQCCELIKRYVWEVIYNMYKVNETVRYVYVIMQPLVRRFVL